MKLTYTVNIEERCSSVTTMSFPAFSGLLATLIEAAAAAPEEIPT